LKHFGPLDTRLVSSLIVTPVSLRPKSSWRRRDFGRLFSVVRHPTRGCRLDSGRGGRRSAPFRTLLSKAPKDDEKRETIIIKMEELRKSVSDEQEDILLEVMDFLVGWCSPHTKL